MPRPMNCGTRIVSSYIMEGRGGKGREGKGREGKGREVKGINVGSCLLQWYVRRSIMLGT